jgi:pilus assembly protein Flp/PilA
MNKVIGFFKDESGATMVEYGLMVALIAIAALTAVNTLGGNVSTTFNNAANSMSS